MNPGQLCTCGHPSVSRCAGCKLTGYCGEEHQKAHWKKGGHKAVCKALNHLKTNPKDGFVKNIVTEGEGPSPKAGTECKVHYVGTLLNGREFDSSRKRGTEFKFTVGVGQVIKAWDEGVMSMKKGERATLIAHPEFAYGAHGAGNEIPPNAHLVFDVELIDF